MPELPEVEVVKKSLENKLKNLTIKRVYISNNKLRYKIDSQQFNKIKGQKIDNVVKSVANKKKKKKKKKNAEPYSEDYLKNKHGIKIIDPSTASTISNKSNLKKRTSFGFYNTVLTLIVLFTGIFGILVLTEEMIVEKYPFFEIYIDYLFETINNFKLIFEDLLRD